MGNQYTFTKYTCIKYTSNKYMCFKNTGFNIFVVRVPRLRLPVYSNTRS